VPGLDYPFEGSEVLRRAWDACPASYLASPQLAVAVSLFVTSETSAISGWPDAYAAWVEDYLTDLRIAVDKKRAEAIKRRSP